MPDITTAPATEPSPEGGARGSHEAIVVSETHWDRDWYMTFQQYRRRLVYVMDRLLDLLETNSAFRTFTFDGQACVLEDYLRIRPENTDRIRALSREGRLVLGPWYTLPDEWLVSGESMIRNILTGRRVARRFGPVNTVGYCPDAFGHVNQLPQVLAGMGLTCAIFTRGMGDELERLGLTFRWQSADPEISLLAIHQLGGYGNASALGYEHRHCDMPRADFSLERAVEYVNHCLERMGPLTRTRALLFNNGVDHMEAQWNLPEVIEHVNGSSLGVQLRHGTFQDFVDAVNAESPELESHQGEFHHGREHVILPGTLSTRVYLKQANDRCQSWLEGLAEPLAAFAQLTLGGEDLRGFLREAWRLLLLNHPHDDICGCSVDQVHREMIPRFDQVQQVTELIAGESLRRLAAQTKPTRPDAVGHAAVFNPSAWERRGEVDFTIALPSDSVGADESLHLVAPDGEILPAMFTPAGARHTHAFMDFDPVNPQTHCNEWRVRLATRDLPPMGVEVLAVERGPSGGLSGVVATDTTLENECCAVTVNPNGTVDIECRETGTAHRGLLLLEDVADAGDEYDFSAPDDPGAVTTAACKATSELIAKGPHSATLAVRIPWQTPSAIDEARENRLPESVDNTVETRLTLRKESPVLEAEIHWTNRACDHRLRAVFPTDIVADHASAEAHFDVIDRPLEPVAPKTKWEQDPVNFHPMDRFVSVSDGERGLAVLGEGLKEYEATRTEDGTRLEVTLLRAVGWLSRDDLKSGRPIGNAGPKLPTPEAQCLGEQSVRLAIMPHRGDWHAGDVHRRAVEFNVPLLARQIETPGGPGEAVGSLLEATPDDLLVTAVKIAEERDALIVRVLNLGPKPVTGRLTLGADVTEAWLTNLAEERQAQLEVIGGRSVEVPVRPRQIVTVELSVT